MKVTHLTLDDRKYIQHCLEEGFSKAKIAREFGKSPPQYLRKLESIGLSSLQVHTVEALAISAKTPASLNNVSAARKNAKTLRSESANDVRELVYVTTALTIKSVDWINTTIMLQKPMKST